MNRAMQSLWIVPFGHGGQRFGGLELSGASVLTERFSSAASLGGRPEATIARMVRWGHERVAQPVAKLVQLDSEAERLVSCKCPSPVGRQILLCSTRKSCGRRTCAHSGSIWRG